METITLDEEFIESPSAHIRGSWVQPLTGAFDGYFVLRDPTGERHVRVMDLDDIRGECEWMAFCFHEPDRYGGSDAERWDRYARRRYEAEWWADVYRFCAGDR